MIFVVNSLGIITEGKHGDRDVVSIGLSPTRVWNIKAGRLIPIIGSGFTRGCSAKNGIVPSGDDMTKLMIRRLEELDKSFVGKLSGLSFSKIGNYYEKLVPKQERYQYLEKNFTEVNIDSTKKKFLEINWPYIYTLNVDDAIERVTDYKSILPCQQFNQDYIERNRCLFKLHGDATTTLKYNTEYIFSEKQYLRSLQDNKYLLDLLRNDLLSNNVIFIGCSLGDEIDIFSQVINYTSTNDKKETYYVTKIEPDLMGKSQLEDYGVTKVIIVDDYTEFFKKIIEIFKESNKLSTDELIEYINPRFVIENQNGDNAEYLFNSNLSLHDFKKRVINLPFYFVDRWLGDKIVKRLDSKTLQIVCGRRISGKTFCMYMIIKKIHDRDIYYFPSSITINSKTLEEVLRKKKAILLFDSNSLDDKQIKYITEKVLEIKNNGTRIVITVNTSDREVTNIMSMDNDDIYIDDLVNRFSETECRGLNQKLSLAGMPKFNPRKSILDNIFDIENIIKTKPYSFKVEKPKEIYKLELVTFILLATKENITSYDMIRFKMVEDIGKIVEKYTPVIQFEYTSLIEKANHSGFKIIPNAKYWLLVTIGEYSRNIKNHHSIVEAYKYIAECLTESISDQYQRWREILDYIRFDTINDIFYKKEQGVSTLINRIYEEMHDYLSDFPQYFHQRAKSKYFLNLYNETGLQDALKDCLKAKHDLEATANLNKPSVQQSISHIRFTLSRIYGRLANVNKYSDVELVKTAIDAYYEAVNDIRNQSYVNHLLEKTKRYHDKETADIIRLISETSTNPVLRNCIIDSKEKLDFLATRLGKTNSMSDQYK